MASYKNYEKMANQKSTEWANLILARFEEQVNKIYYNNLFNSLIFFYICWVAPKKK